MGNAKTAARPDGLCSTQGGVSDIVWLDQRDMGKLKGSETKGVMGDRHVNQTFQKMRVLQGDESTAV